VSLAYVDSSALVKLVRDEPESAVLRAYLLGAELASSELVLTEVPRAIRRASAADPRLSLETLMAPAEAVIEALGLIPLDRRLLLAAGAFVEPALRALDAIHVAAAVWIAPIDAFVTHDERQAAAARLAGLRTMVPGD